MKYVPGRSNTTQGSQTEAQHVLETQGSSLGWQGSRQGLAMPSLGVRQSEEGLHLDPTQRPELGPTEEHPPFLQENTHSATGAITDHSCLWTLTLLRPQTPRSLPPPLYLQCPPQTAPGSKPHPSSRGQ